MGADSVEEARGEFCESEGRGQADGYGDEGEEHALADDEALDGAELRAEGHADADLAGAAADGVAHDAVEADGGEHESNEAEDSEECAGEAGQEESVVEVLLHGVDVVDGDGRVEGVRSAGARRWRWRRSRLRCGRGACSP